MIKVDAKKNKHLTIHLIKHQNQYGSSHREFCLREMQTTCCRLTVVCNSSDVAKAARKNWRSAQLPKNISIRSDQTPLQQEVLRDLNNNLVKQTNENPLAKKIIKYIRGKVRIVDASKKRNIHFSQKLTHVDSVLSKHPQCEKQTSRD